MSGAASVPVAPAASLGAGGAEGSSANGAGGSRDTAGRQGMATDAPEASSAAASGEKHGSSSPHSFARAKTSDSKHEGPPSAKGRASAQGRTGGTQAHKPKPTPQAGTDFSRTLALSLSAPVVTKTPVPEKTDGKPAKKTSGPEASKGDTTDPVALALAWMGHTGPVLRAPAPAGAGAEASGQPGKPAASRAVTAPGAHSTQAVSDTLQHEETQALIHAAAESAPLSKVASAPSGGAAHGVGSTGTPGRAETLAAAQLAAGAQALPSNLSATAPGPALTAPVGSSAWTEQLGARLTWMTQQGVQSASLQLSPQHLGPLQVSISVQHGQASVWFGAAQADTRQALARAMPELRAMFANQGLTLTDSGVSHDAPRDAHRSANRGVTPVGEVGGVETVSSSASAALTGVGLIDTYA